ncbi:MAG: zinc-ribbon domain-containing protein [Dehalococcoidia bacterium]|nr:zinc-ribbon domain-containing protein [Dehalococcoidia bacterium]
MKPKVSEIAVLVREWHPKKNGSLGPDDITTSSKKKVWWLCEHGHEWEAVVGNRTKGSGCPLCWNSRL